MKAYLKLARWPNLIIVGLIFVLAKTQVVDPISELTGVVSCLEVWHWIALAMSTVFIAASGNVINDIFDQDIDFHNKPDKRIIGKLISEEKAWNYYYGLGSAGLGLGMFLCWKLGNVTNSLIFMMAAGGLYFYSYAYKRQFLIGNITVALLAGLVPLLPVFMHAECNPETWLELPWAPFLMMLSVFSFLTTLIREMIKDLEDIKGDQMMRCRTMPIVIGTGASKAVILVLVTALIALIAWLQKGWWTEGSTALIYYFGIAAQLPAIIIAAQVLMAKESHHYRKASTISKVLMVGGILSMVVFNLTLE